MYSSIFTSKMTSADKDSYLMHILFDGLIVSSSFIQVEKDSTQDILDSIANAAIDTIEGF